jgi:hypothetical protein
MDRSKIKAPGEAAADQREDLADSERRATETEPQNFRDQANADKVVEILPTEAGESSSIQGIDPKR